MKKILQALERAAEDVIIAKASPEADSQRLGESVSLAVAAPDIRGLPTHPLPLDVALLQRHRLRRGNENDGAANAYRMIRTQLLQTLERNGWRSIAVVSAAAGDGRTLSALNLALSISRDPAWRALVVDLDFRNPSLHHLLELEFESGIADYIARKVDLERIVTSVDNDRLQVLPCLAPIPCSSDVLKDPMLARLVTELASPTGDRVVLFDLPPILLSDDAISFLPHVDCVLLIVCEGHTRLDDLARMRELLGDRPIAGMIMNKVTPRRSGGG